MNYWIFYLSKILALRYKRFKKIFLFLLKKFCTIYFGHNSFPFPNSSQILSQALYQPNFMLVWAKKLLPSGTLWEIADFPSRCQLQIVSYKGMRKLCPLTLLTAAVLSSLWKFLGVCITPVVSGGHCFPWVIFQPLPSVDPWPFGRCLIQISFWKFIFKWLSSAQISERSDFFYKKNTWDFEFF